MLESTSCARKGRILEAIDGLEAGGGTAGGAGLRRAYDVAVEHFMPGRALRRLRRGIWPALLIVPDGDRSAIERAITSSLNESSSRPLIAYAILFR